MTIRNDAMILLDWFLHLQGIKTTEDERHEMPRMSQAEYEAFLAKSSTHWETHPRFAECATDESKLHDEIIDYCRTQGWAYFHGSMAHKTRRTLGEPDFVIWAESPKVWLVECKKKNEKPSPAQLSLHAQLAKLGWTVHVVRCMADFIAIVAT